MRAGLRTAGQFGPLGRPLGSSVSSRSWTGGSAKEVVRSVEHERVGDDRQRGERPVRREPLCGGHPTAVTLGRGCVPDRPVGAPGRHFLEDGLPANLVEELGVTEPQRHLPPGDAVRQHG